MLRIISLGAGVQSTTMALMAAHGEITPMPDCAIFADTGWEPKAIYEHLAELELKLPFPVYRVQFSNIRDDLLRRSNPRSKYFDYIPSYILRGSKEGLGRRQCTSHYKVEPIRKKCRELVGRGDMVEKWIGISVDEIFRATPSKIKSEIKRFPLLEQRMSRGDCINWLKRSGYKVPPKSSCIGCPFRSDAGWRSLTPEEWIEAVEVDKSLRITRDGKAQQFLHRSRLPLENADLSTVEDHGQLNMFNNECEGMCGV